MEQQLEVICECIHTSSQKSFKRQLKRVSRNKILLSKNILVLGRGLCIKCCGLNDFGGRMKIIWWVPIDWQAGPVLHSACKQSLSCNTLKKYSTLHTPKHIIYITPQCIASLNLFTSNLLSEKIMCPTLFTLGISLTSLWQMFPMTQTLHPLLPIPLYPLYPHLLIILHPNTPLSNMRRSLLPSTPVKFGVPPLLTSKYPLCFLITLLTVILFLFLQMTLFLSLLFTSTLAFTDQHALSFPAPRLLRT